MPQSDKLAEAVVAYEEVLRGERAVWEALWQQIARYLLPRQARFTEEVSEGVLRNRHVLDSTGPRSLELFASFLHTTNNNPATQWFNIGVRGESDPSTQAAQWLEDTERHMLHLMGAEGSNLYEHLHSNYLSLGAYGTAPLFVDMDGQLPRYRSYHLGDVVVAEGANGLIDTAIRQFQYDARQARQRWPEGYLGASLEKAGAGPDRKARFLHAVIPTTDKRFADLLPSEAKISGFASVWVNAEDKVTVERGSYEEFPWVIPRWYREGCEIYGRSPGMTALPDVQTVNRLMETILRGAEKLVDPPLLLPDGALLSPVRLFPGGISFTDGAVTPQPLIPPGASRIEVGHDLLEQRQQAIREAFFVPLFSTPDSPVKTATQVMQEVDERNRAISPMLIRSQSELFHPLIRRTFNMLSRAGQLPPMPPELEGAELSIEYVSPLIASQRQMDGLSIMRMFESLAPWGQVDPGIFDKFDPDETAKAIHEASGAPASIVRTDAKVKDVRRARQQQEQAQQAAQMGFEGADAAAKLISANSKRGSG